MKVFKGNAQDKNSSRGENRLNQEKTLRKNEKLHRLENGNERVNKGIEQKIRFKTENESETQKDRRKKTKN